MTWEIGPGYIIMVPGHSGLEKAMDIQIGDVVRAAGKCFAEASPT